jgi:hypothetical protein
MRKGPQQKDGLVAPVALQTGLKPEAREILLYGDGDLTLDTFGWVVYRDYRALLCDFSDGEKPEKVKLIDVLAENPFAIVKAPGCDRMRRLVIEEAKAKTAVELLAYVARKANNA